MAVICAQISSRGAPAKMVPISGFSWQSYNEQTPSADDGDTLAMQGLWEQVNVTRDSSDYLWYLTEYVSIRIHFVKLLGPTIVIIANSFIARATFYAELK